MIFTLHEFSLHSIQGGVLAPMQMIVTESPLEALQEQLSVYFKHK